MHLKNDRGIKKELNTCSPFPKIQCFVLRLKTKLTYKPTDFRRQLRFNGYEIRKTVPGSGGLSIVLCSRKNKNYTEQGVVSSLTFYIFL